MYPKPGDLSTRLGTLFLGAGGIDIGLGFLVQGFFQSHIHTSIPWWVGGAAGLAIAFTLNHFGIRIAIRGVLILATPIPHPSAGTAG
jgi:hypothetical protein